MKTEIFRFRAASSRSVIEKKNTALGFNVSPDGAESITALETVDQRKNYVHKAPPIRSATWPPYHSGTLLNSRYFLI